jgi:alanine racemase
VHISAAALRHNLARVHALAPKSRVLAVIKADGYGHGLIETARALDAADAFAVARLDEALALRAAGVDRPMVLLEGCADVEELTLCATHALEPVLHHAQQVEALCAAHLATPITVWLKLDTGMHRLGFAPRALPGVLARLAQCAAVKSAPRFLTHFACADEADASFTREQAACFERALEGRAGERSLANSAAILRHPALHADWVRPGLMLYGVSPFAGECGAQLGLRPAMQLETRLIAVNHHPRGTAIGYGRSWICPEPMPVGVAAIGYGDGYPRHARPGTPVLVNGVRVPLIGRVSMDMITLDLRAVPLAARGDPVLLWGADLPVETIADHADTIPYTLLCGLTARVARNCDENCPESLSIPSEG